MISDINTNIDFSNNYIKITEADAKIQSHPIKISGNIDKKANADIKVTGEKINVSDISKLIPKTNEYKISGLLDFSAILKGQLKSLYPKSYLQFYQVIGAYIVLYKPYNRHEVRHNS